MASWNTWDWGSGTQADPYKVMSLKELNQLFADNLTNPDPDSFLAIYVEFATHDRQGNPIPVSERIDDCRHNSWILESNGFRTYFNTSYPIKVYINGNGWTILGVSLRRSHLINASSNLGGGSPSYNKDCTVYIENLIFKNVYLQGGGGRYSLLYVYGLNTRVEISNCKFSGVIDNSGNNSYSTSQGNNVNNNTDSGGGVNVFTACSFNFKFIGHFKLAHSKSTGAPNGTEFNNCLFNFSGKYTGTTSSNPGPTDFAYMYGAIMYFCKCQGQIIMDTNVGNLYLYMFFDYGGTLNVVDVDIRVLDSVANDLVVFYRHSNATSKDIFYVQPDKSYEDFSVDCKGNAASFIRPSNRAQLEDVTWLEDQGFIIGSAPTE